MKNKIVFLFLLFLCFKTQASEEISVEKFGEKLEEYGFNYFEKSEIGDLFKYKLYKSDYINNQTYIDDEYSPVIHIYNYSSSEKITPEIYKNIYPNYSSCLIKTAYSKSKSALLVIRICNKKVNFIQIITEKIILEIVIPYRELYVNSNLIKDLINVFLKNYSQIKNGENEILLYSEEWFVMKIYGDSSYGITNSHYIKGFNKKTKNYFEGIGYSNMYSEIEESITENMEVLVDGDYEKNLIGINKILHEGIEYSLFQTVSVSNNLLRITSPSKDKNYLLYGEVEKEGFIKDFLSMLKHYLK